MRLFRNEEGTSMPELMIGFLISSVVVIIILASYKAIVETDRYTDQDTRALSALRFSTKRIEKEVREARRVYSATGTTLKVWVDHDRDNQQDLDERITWENVAVGTQGQLRRSTDANPSQHLLVAEELVPGNVFSYDTPTADKATKVSISLTTDIRPGPRPENRTVRTELMLRNAVSSG